MARTKLVNLAEQVREDLEGYYANQPSVRENYLKSFLKMFCTGEIPEELEELKENKTIHGFKANLKKLASFLREEPNLPRSLCARYEYGMSRKQAMENYDVRKEQWDYVHDLAKEHDFDFYLHVPYSDLLDPEIYEWHDKLEKEKLEVEVIIDSRALEDMLICTYEGYKSPQTGRRKGYEVVGINLGMIREEKERKQGFGIKKRQYVYVMRSQPQLSADGNFHEVNPNDKSLDAVIKAGRILFPQYEVVGDFHSHLYGSWQEIQTSKGWEPSEVDERNSPDWAKQIRQMENGNRFVVAFIIAIAESGRRVASGNYKRIPNVLSMDVGDCRFVISAYRVLKTGKYSDKNIHFAISGLIR